MARYRGKVCRLAAPLAKPEQAESILDRRELAISLVDDLLDTKWAIVRIRGRRAGESVVRRRRVGRVKYGLSRVDGVE